jgi:hypothetical protein
MAPVTYNGYLLLDQINPERRKSIYVNKQGSEFLELFIEAETTRFVFYTKFKNAISLDHSLKIKFKK